MEYVDLDNTLCINDYFPNEILVKIFHNLSKTANVRMVCNQWRCIIDELIGHDILVTSFSSIISDLKKLPPENLRDISIIHSNSHLAIRKLVIGVSGMFASNKLSKTKFESITENLEAFPFVAYPHILKRLTCFEPVSPNIFKSLKPLTGLTYLNLSLLTLSSLSVSSVQCLCGTLHLLTTLVISETPTYPEFNNCAAIEQLNTLLACLDAPKLANLSLSYPIRSLLEIDGDSTLPLINRLKILLTTLVKVSICVTSPNQNFTPPQKTFEYPPSLLGEMEHLGQRLQLTSMELKDNHLHSLRPSVQVKAWIHFLNQQTGLISLNLHLKSSIDLGKDLALMLGRNAPTLRKLELSCFPCEMNDEKDIFFVPIDCSFLTNCTVLEKLIVSDRLLNTKYLPTCLKYIYVDAMLTNDDATSILLREDDCPNLEHVELRDLRGGAPKGIGFGLPVTTLKKLIDYDCDANGKQKVGRVVVYVGSLDGKFPADGISNGDPLSPIQLLKRKPPLMLMDSTTNTSSSEFEHILNYRRIDWKLNERGFYEDLLHQCSYLDRDNLFPITS